MTTTSTPDHVGHTPDDILHPDSRRLFRFWESLRKEHSAPRKSDLDLKRITGLLPHIGILQRHPLKPNYHWRLAGTGLCQMFGHELTRSQFMQDWGSFETNVISKALDSAVSGHQPCVARIKASNSLGDVVGLELLALPLVTDKPNITHLLINLSRFRELKGARPRPLTNFELSRVKMIWTEHARGKVHSQPSTCPVEHTGAAATRPVFRVIDGGLSDQK